jgi:hypothetical protein
MNRAETSGGSVTEVLPKCRTDTYPFEIIHGDQVPVRPTPTYTYWKHPNDTFPLGNIVYFVYSAGRIKIGHSDGLRKRIKILSASCPLPSIVLLVIKGGQPMEQKFHDRFAEDRLHAEWFKLSKKMRGFLRARLCPVGRASLKDAEAHFWAYCQEICK